MIDWFLKRMKGPEARARIFRWFWLVSLIFMMIGYAVIFYIFLK